MPTNKVLLRNTFFQLGAKPCKRWLLCSLSYLIALSPIVILSYLSRLAPLVTSIILVLIEAPLMMSATKLSINIACGEPNISPSLLEFGFRNYKNALSLYLLMYFKILLWSLLFIIPGIIKGISYSMAFYIYCDNPEVDGKTCLQRSQDILLGYKKQYFLLMLLSAGIFLLGFAALGIGAFITLPFVYLPQTNFYLARRARLDAENGYRKRELPTYIEE